MSLLDSRGFSAASFFRHSLANNMKAFAGRGIFRLTPFESAILPSMHRNAGNPSGRICDRPSCCSTKIFSSSLFSRLLQICLASNRIFFFNTFSLSFSKSSSFVAKETLNISSSDFSFLQFPRDFSGALQENELLSIACWLGDGLSQLENPSQSLKFFSLTSVLTAARNYFILFIFLNKKIYFYNQS